MKQEKSGSIHDDLTQAKIKSSLEIIKIPGDCRMDCEKTSRKAVQRGLQRQFGNSADERGLRRRASIIGNRNRGHIDDDICDAS